MSSPSYCTHVYFVKDYKEDNFIIKKGEIRSAVHHTNHPGVGMSKIGPNGIPYKVWYDIYDKDVKDVYYSPRGTYPVIRDISEEYVEQIWNLNEFLIKQRKLKLQKLNEPIL